jgi:hypothetical protein
MKLTLLALGARLKTYRHFVSRSGSGALPRAGHLPKKLLLFLLVLLRKLLSAAAHP